MNSNFNFDKYSKYKDSGVEWLGDIPKEWEVLPLFSITKLKSIKNRPELMLLSVYLELGVIRFSDIDEKRTNATSLDLSNYQIVDPGDFVLNNQQAWRGSVGVSKYQGIVSPAYIILSLSNKINPEFANYYFRNGSTVAQYLISSKGVGTIQRNLYWAKLRKTYISLPSLSKQTKIAEFLDRKIEQIDKAISQKEKLIELLKERRQIIIQEAVTKGLNHNVKLKDSGIEWIGKIPEHWEIKRLTSIGSFSKGFGISRAELTKDGENAILYGDIYTKYDIFIKNVYNKISKATAQKAKIITRNVLLFTGSGETIEDIGKCVVYLNNENAYAGGDVITFKQVGSDSLFLSYVLNSNIIKSEKAKYSKGEIIVHIYASKLKNIYIPIPSFTEQKQISEHIETQSSKIAKAISQQEKLIEKLKEYRTVIIDSAVTGKIKVC